MNTRTLQAPGIALLLLTSTSVFGVTDTWDGGGLNDRFSTDANWVDNTAPSSDVNNTDLIFAGAVRLTPDVVGTQFAVRSVTFNNTAGAFNITGTALTVGAGGIANNDANNQSFTATVVAAASHTINAASGPLFFNGGLDISAGSNVTLGGSAGEVINNFGSGTGTLTRNGGGTLSVTGAGVPILADLLLNAGTTILSGTGTHIVGSTGSIAVGTGATLTTGEDLTLSGGAQMTRASGGTLNLAPGKTLRIESGSDFVSSGNQPLPVGNVTVTGAGSTFHIANTSLTLNTGSTLSVENGGSASTAFELNIPGGTLIAQGPGTSVGGGGFISSWGSDGSAATVTFTNNATGSFESVAMANSLGSAANVQVLSGADIIISRALFLSTSDESGVSTLLLSGAGTTWQTGQGILIGGPSGSPGTLTVSDGAAFTDDDSMVIGATGIVHLDGGSISERLVINSGTVDLDRGTLTVLNAFRNNGTLNLDGGALTVDFFENSGTLNFTAGKLEMLGFGNNLTVGTGGLLGANLTLLADRELAIGGTTTIDAARTLTLNGGTFRTRALVNNGTLDFQRGVLGITGFGGFTIGAGALGSNVTLGAGSTLQVTNTATIAGGATLTLNGGTFTAGTLQNSGTIRADFGLASAGSGSNNSGGRIFIGDILDVAGALTNAAGARITLEDGTGLLSGAGALTNAGLLTGDGTILKPLTNTTTGEVRGESGRTLYFTGAATNNGQFNLLGGSLDFSAQVTNSASGFISGRGALYTGGLTNNGVMAFSGGNADIFGDVTNAAGARIVTSGAGATTTFYDDVVHGGLEIFTGANASTVFFGSQSGAGSYTGSGTIYFIGDLQPGSSPAIINFAPQVVFTPSSVLTMEVGGDTAGSEHDKLVFTHAGAPQITWAGTLVVELVNNFTPAAGDAFDVFDFDAARDTGAFSTIIVVDHDLLPPGLAFNLSELYTTGIIRVVSTTGTTFAQWVATVLGDPGALPHGDHNNNGYDNLTEYALAFLPAFPGASEPGGGLHVYPEGERMRVLFWRHIDRTDVTIRVQVSTNLVTWNDLAVSVNSAPFTGAGFVSENRAHPLSEPGLVEVRDILNASSEARRYLRIMVMLSP